MIGNTPVFDREDLLARVMGNERLLRRVVEAFNADMPRMLIALAASCGGCSFSYQLGSLFGKDDDNPAAVTGSLAARL